MNMAFKFIFICNACDKGTEKWPVMKAHFKRRPEHVYGGHSAVTVLPIEMTQQTEEVRA